MYGDGKSHSPIIPTKPPNEAEPEAKEAVEERGLAKGKTLERNRFRTQRRRWSASGTTLHTISIHASRPDLRQEPDALVALVRICGGGGQ